MHITNNHGHKVHVPRHLEKAVRKHIKAGNHDEITQLMANAHPQPGGMSEGPTQQPNGTMFKSGGSIFGDIADYARNVGAFAADNTLSAVGLSNVADKNGWYSDSKMGKTAQDVSKVTNPLFRTAGQLAATAVGGPAAGMAMGQIQNAAGSIDTPSSKQIQNYNSWDQAGQTTTQVANTASMALNPKMASGGLPPQQQNLVPVNIEKGELLVNPDGTIYKDYKNRPSHPADGSLDPGGNEQVPPGLVIIPQKRREEYLGSSRRDRKAMIASIISQQEDRIRAGSEEIKKALGGSVFGEGGQEPDPETLIQEMNKMGKGGWIQKATASIHRRGTEGVCTGSKFGGPTCPPGSKRYNLAKTFRAMKHEDGGAIKAEDGLFTGPPTFNMPGVNESNFLTAYNTDPNQFNMTDASGNAYSVSPGTAYGNVLGGDPNYKLPEQQRISKDYLDNLNKNTNYDTGKMTNDALRLAPVATNIAMGFSKEQKVTPYTTSQVQYTPGNFGYLKKALIEQGIRSRYDAQDANPNRAASIAGQYATNKAISDSYGQYLEGERQGRQANAQLNAEISQRNNMMRYQADQDNRKIHGERLSKFADAATAAGQIGTENQYLDVMSNNPDAYKKMFYGYKRSRRGGKVY